MAAGLRARVPVAFEDVLVRFSPEEWAVLAEGQRELYWAVMKENYALVAWLGSAGAAGEVTWKADEDEEPDVGAPRGKGGGGVPQPPSVGSAEARSDGWVVARGRAGPCVWPPRVSGVPLHQGQVCERQSDQRPARVPVVFEDVEVRFSPAEWAVLVEGQRELYWAVMKENYELVAWLGAADPRPESSGEEPQEGEIPEPPSTGAEEPPRGGATGVPVPQGKVPNTCSDCGQSFSERALLIVHVLRTHLGERRLPCGECGKLLSGRGRLAAHQSAHLRERTFTCVACARSFVYHSHVVDQVRMELAGGKPFKCTKCSNRLVLMVEPGPPFPCPHCPKVFLTAYLLQRHQLRHTGEAAFPCAQCGRRFPGRGSLAIHLRAHARPLLHPCAQCGQRFGSKRALLAHQRDHAPDRPCRECGQVFGSRKARTAHRLEHERQRPFTCAECGKGFRRQDRYTLHQRLHAGPPPLACPQCSQHFRLPLQLERHQRLHQAPRVARLRARAQACPAGELGPTPGPASPSVSDPGPGPSPAWAVGSPPGK